MQSGAPAGDPGVTGNITLVNTAAVAALAGCTGSDSAQVLTCMRQISTGQLLQAVLQFENQTAGTPQDIFFPTVDGSYIPQAPSTLLRTGRFHKHVSVITGFNEDDGTLFTPPTLNDSDAVLEYLHLAYPNITQSTLSTLVSMYPVSQFTAKAQANSISPYFYQAAQVYRDINFACPEIDVAHRVAGVGSPSYVYNLNTSSLTDILTLLNASFYGVVHLSDVPFAFDTPSVGFGFGATAQNNLTATRVSGSWLQFAKAGNPSSSNTDNTLGPWPQAFNKTQASIASQNVTAMTIKVIGGPNAGTQNLTLAPGGKIEPGLLQRCQYINSPAFYAQINT
jgi:carboxylesterase type B